MNNAPDDQPGQHTDEPMSKNGMPATYEQPAQKDLLAKPRPYRRNPAQIANDRVFIAELLMKGLTHQKITDALNARSREENRGYQLSRETITRESWKIVEEWKEESVDTIEKMRYREIMGLARQEEELWAAWERSKQAKQRKSVTEESGGSGGKGGTRKSMTEEKVVGDGTFQRLILEVRSQRARLLGLNSPERTELSGPDGAPVAMSGGQSTVIVLPAKETIPEESANPLARQ